MRLTLALPASGFFVVVVVTAVVGAAGATGAIFLQAVAVAAAADVTSLLGHSASSRARP